MIITGCRDCPFLEKLCEWPEFRCKANKEKFLTDPEKEQQGWKLKSCPLPVTVSC